MNTIPDQKHLRSESEKGGAVENQPLFDIKAWAVHYTRAVHGYQQEMVL